MTPDFLWYLIVHEVAEYVRQNPREHAHIFTDTPDSKQVIVVRDDSLSRADPSGWRRSVDLVRGPLRAKISDYSLGLFLPQFSTTTEEAQTALLIALMDVVSPFYQFKWYSLCGIPQIRLEGDAADWRSLHFRADLLAREFGGLSGYFKDLLPVLQAIAETASGMAPTRSSGVRSTSTTTTPAGRSSSDGSLLSSPTSRRRTGRSSRASLGPGTPSTGAR